MATLVEMALEMVMARARITSLTADEMVADLKRFHLELKNLDSPPVTELPKQEQKHEQEQEKAPDDVPFHPALSMKDAFKKHEIGCMVCGKGGFKYLGKHLRSVHGLEPKQYREMCGIPRSQSLTAKSFTEPKSRNSAAKPRTASEETKSVRRAAKRKSAEKASTASATDHLPEKTKLATKRVSPPAATVAAAE